MSTSLQPTIVSTFVEAGDTLFDGIRRRPVAAYTQSGAAVVCSARTARKYGWSIVARAWKRA